MKLHVILQEKVNTLKNDIIDTIISTVKTKQVDYYKFDDVSIKNCCKYFIVANGVNIISNTLTTNNSDIELSSLSIEKLLNVLQSIEK